MNSKINEKDIALGNYVAVSQIDGGILYETMAKENIVEVKLIGKSETRRLWETTKVWGGENFRLITDIKSSQSWISGSPDYCRIHAQSDFILAEENDVLGGSFQIIAAKDGVENEYLLEGAGTGSVWIETGDAAIRITKQKGSLYIAVFGNDRRLGEPFGEIKVEIP